MAEDIEWHTMWLYKVDGTGPQKVAEGLLAPIMAEWTSFALTPLAYIAEGNMVVSLGHFTGVHAISGKSVDAAYAHVWDMAGGKIQCFGQYIDTLAVAEAGDEWLDHLMRLPREARLHKHKPKGPEP
jgi:ketosteroid isomerase-like protein